MSAASTGVASARTLVVSVITSAYNVEAFVAELIATLTGMVDTAKTGPLRMTVARRDDYILWLSLLKRGLVARGLQEDLARYRVVRGSLSSKPKRSAAWVWAVYREVEKLGRLHAAWCMLHYGARAVMKRLVF
jgi:teichuronic acid biosynthesis glycosyltransferase TuaG